MGDVEKEAESFHAAKDEFDERRSRLYAAIRKAAAEGIPASRIARSAGLSRERVRQIVAADD